MLTNPETNWAAELGPLQQGDIELLEDAIAALENASATSLDAEHALHGLRKRVEIAREQQRKPVVQMLSEVDDHLQELQHYGHSHQLRNAISIVQDMQDALEEARTGLCWYQDAHPEDVDGSDGEAMERIDAAIAKATGGAQ